VRVEKKPVVSEAAVAEQATVKNTATVRKSKTGVIVVGCVAACLLLVAAVFAWKYLGGRQYGAMPTRGEASLQGRITFTDADDFIREWSAYQTNRDVKSYLELYSTDFQGIKRTKSGRTYRLDFPQWATDRSRMYAGARWVAVTATGLKVTGTDDSSGAVTVEFDQTYDSDSYHDTGRKLMTLKRDATGRIRIAREEMVYALASASPADERSPDYHDAPAATLPGRFPECSLRLLDRSDLLDKSAFDLKVMRNEIYARHGYIFRLPDMRSYFSGQAWYTPQYQDVTGMLTPIEKGNIELIRRYERQL
jgi:hypothetical protein